MVQLRIPYFPNLASCSILHLHGNACYMGYYYLKTNMQDNSIHPRWYPTPNLFFRNSDEPTHFSFPFPMMAFRSENEIRIVKVTFEDNWIRHLSILLTNHEKNSWYAIALVVKIILMRIIKNNLWNIWFDSLIYRYTKKAFFFV